MGKCRLCLNDAELRDSHFIPQAAYKRVRGQGANPHPVVVHGRKVIQTAAQTRAHLLRNAGRKHLLSEVLQRAGTVQAAGTSEKAEAVVNSSMLALETSRARALLIRRPWIDKILGGEKALGIRGSRTSVQGQVGLIASGSGPLTMTGHVVLSNL